MTEARSIGKWTDVAIGDVSVSPQAESMSTRSPRAWIEQASMRSQSGLGSDAAAWKITSRSRKNVARRASSRSRQGRSMSKPRGTLKYSVGEISRSVATERSMSPGAGGARS